MARIGFALAGLASLAFLGWFIAVESESPGLSFAAALIGLPLLVALFGFSKAKGTGLTKDGFGAGWAAIVIALVGVAYLATFFSGWLLIAGLWVALHVPLAIALITTSTAEG